MADRCTAEYERIVAKLGASMPYRRARGLLAEFFPLGDDVPEVETNRATNASRRRQVENAEALSPGEVFSTGATT